MIVMRTIRRETVLKKETIPFTGDFAFFLFDVPEITDRGTLNGGTYKATVLLLDENQRIVGEKNLGPFPYKTFYNIRDEKGADTGRTESWMNNTLGQDDVVWEGFEPIKANAAGLDTNQTPFQPSRPWAAGADRHQARPARAAAGEARARARPLDATRTCWRSAAARSCARRCSLRR